MDTNTMPQQLVSSGPNYSQKSVDPKELSLEISKLKGANSELDIKNKELQNILDNALHRVKKQTQHNKATEMRYCNSKTKIKELEDQILQCTCNTASNQKTHEHAEQINRLETQNKEVQERNDETTTRVIQENEHLKTRLGTTNSLLNQSRGRINKLEEEIDAHCKENINKKEVGLLKRIWSSVSRLVLSTLLFNFFVPPCSTTSQTPLRDTALRDKRPPPSLPNNISERLTIADTSSHQPQDSSLPPSPSNPCQAARGFTFLPPPILTDACTTLPPPPPSSLPPPSNSTNLTQTHPNPPQPQASKPAAAPKVTKSKIRIPVWCAKNVNDLPSILIFDIIEVLNGASKSYTFMSPYLTYPPAASAGNNFALVLAICGTERIDEKDRTLVNELRKNGVANVMVIVLRRGSESAKFKPTQDLTINSGIPGEKVLLQLVHTNKEILKDDISKSTIEKLMIMLNKVYSQ